MTAVLFDKNGDGKNPVSRLFPDRVGRTMRLQGLMNPATFDRDRRIERCYGFPPTGF